MKENAENPMSDVRHDVEQLALEKQQLLDRLDREKSQTRNNPNFQKLLEETNKMRRAQDDEIRLEEQKKEQLQCLAAAKQRLKQARHIYDVLRAMTLEQKPVDDILNELENESQKSLSHLESNIMQQRHKLELKLLQTEKDLVGSIKTENDIEYVEEVAAQLEDTLNKKREEIENLNRHNKNLSKLLIFKQHVNVAASKLRAKQEEVDEKTTEKELLLSTNHMLKDSKTRRNFREQKRI